MPVFEYRAIRPSGEPVSGTLHSASLAAAADMLAREGLEVQHVGLAQPSGATPAAERSGSPGAYGPAERSAGQAQVVAPLIGRVGLGQLQSFFRQLAQMLHAGVPPVQALDTLSGQAINPFLSQTIREMRDAASAGRPMSEVMVRYPEVYSPLMTSLVTAGEQAGILEETLRQVVQYIEHEIELRNLLRRVTFYPKLVLAFSVVMILLVNLIIASLGKQGGIWSPLTTPATWIVLGPLIVALIVFVRIGLHQPSVKSAWDQFVLVIPVLGKTLKELAMAKFGRAFGALYRAGIEPHRAILLAADASGNEHVRERIRPAAAWIRDGRGITDSFRATGVFSPVVLDMTHTGEITGNLDNMLENMADFYEEEARVKTHQFARIFGVAVLVVVAIYVFIVLLNFYAGYFGSLGAGAE